MCFDGHAQQGFQINRRHDFCDILPAHTTDDE
jgi:hypothetical protein